MSSGQNPESGVGGDHWALVAHFRSAVPELASKFEIDFVRDVSEQERAAIGDAATLLGDFGSMWRWNQVRSASAELLGLVEASTVAFSKAKAVNSAHVRQVNLSLHSLVKNVHKWLIEVDSPDWPSVANANSSGGSNLVAATRKTSPVALLLRMAELNSSINLVDLSVPNSPNGALIPMASVEAKIAIGFEASIELRLDVVIADAVRLLELVACEVLLAYEEELSRAASRLAMVGAETVGGQPALIIKSAFERMFANPHQKHQPKMEYIPAGDAAAMVARLRTARQIFQKYEVSAIREQVEREERNRNAVARAIGPNPSEEAEGRRSTRTIDISSAVARAGQLTVSMEQEWSKALDSAKGWAKELFGQWASIVNTIQDHLLVRTTMLADRGFHTRLPATPLGQREIELFEVVPTGQQAVAQLGVAETEVLEDLLAAIRGVREPSARSLDVVTGATSSWWEAGAFAQIRDVAAMSYRICREFDKVSQGSDPFEAAAREWIDEFQIATDCMRHGLYEPALIFLNRAALRIDRSDSDLLGQSKKDLVLLADVSARLARGDDMTTGITVPLARYWIRRIERLAQERFLESHKPEN